MGENDVLTVILTALHIAFAAVWFGNRIGLTSDISETIHDMDGPAEGLIRRMVRSARFDWMAAAGVFVTGALLVVRIGPGDVGVSVWLGAAAALALVVVTLLLTRPARKDLKDALAGGLRPEAVAAVKKVSASGRSPSP
jgi:hypothetical protein